MMYQHATHRIRPPHSRLDQHHDQAGRGPRPRRWGQAL